MPFGECELASATTSPPEDFASLPGERPAANVTESPADRGSRVDVDQEQRFLETWRTGEHALVVEHDRVPVEDQLVLAADGVAERDEADVVSRARRASPRSRSLPMWNGDAERLTTSSAPASARSVAGGLPEVLADRDSDVGSAEQEHDEVAPGREVAVLVENAVVREEALAVDRLDLAVRAHGGRVVKIGVEVRCADERDDAADLGRDLAQRALGGADEPGPEQQVSGGNRSSPAREEDEVGAASRASSTRLRIRSRFPSRSPTTVSICARASLMRASLAVFASGENLPDRQVLRLEPPPQDLAAQDRVRQQGIVAVSSR